MVTAKLRQEAFERLAQLLAVSERNIPAQRYVREATTLNQLVFDTDRFSVDVHRVFGILITPSELSVMKTVGDIVQRMASTVTVPEQVLSQEQARKIHRSLSEAVSLDVDLQRFELLFRVHRQQGVIDPIRFRWASMHQLPEIKVEYRPADLIDWGDDSHFDISETHADVQSFVRAYNL